MTYQAAIDQGKAAFDSLTSLDTNLLFQDQGNLPAWNGAGVGDFRSAFENVVETLEAFYDSDVLVDIPFNLISSINSQLNKILQTCSQFLTNRNQQHFHAAFQQVESLRTNLHTWGLSTLTILGPEVQSKISQINEELNFIIGRKSEIETLKANVESLIQPAVSGSLSKAFSDRKEALESNEKKWFWVSVITAVIAVISTIAIVFSIVGFFEGASQTAKAAQETKDAILWSTIALRLGILLPIYAVFTLAFAQYSKERNLEEEYAHRSAVATSLPNYGNLAVDSKVKDQILSEASNVIFSSPTRKHSFAADKKSAVPGMDQLNDLVKNLQKLVKPSTDAS